MDAQIANLLRQSLDSRTSRAAEQSLRSVEGHAEFAQLLLGIVATTTHDISTRQAAALFFKNFVKRSWTEDDTTSKISEADRDAVKRDIVRFMTQMPPALQVQIGEAATLIANSDFPTKWQSLVDDLISNISLTDMTVTNGVLLTAHSIFRRWRSQFRSDDLFREIAFVLQKFCEPFLTLLQQTDKLIDENKENKETSEILFQTLLLLTRVFYDLNCQDIPEFFEDHMKEFMVVFHKYLTYYSPLLDPADEEDTASPLQKVKASICEIVELYTQRYEEIFSMLPDFVNTIWTLLTATGLEQKNDILVSKSLSFLTTVVKIPRHAQLFQSAEVLRQFVENIVLPNMSLRAADEELFVDDPIEFIRRDLEGSDSDTRRRAATDFVRGLVEQFESSITAIVLTYVQHYLQEYGANRRQNWKCKDTANYLVSAVAAKGFVTKIGVTSTNLMVDVVEYFNSNVLPDLQAAFEDLQPILKVDAIKFVHTFRNQLTKAQIRGVFPLLVHHLTAPNYVVFTYAAVTIETLLSLRRDNTAVFSKTDISPVAIELLGNLFQLVERGETPEKLAENDFLMRCIMRVIVAAQEQIAGATQLILEHLTKILAEISKNPSNPRFNHYVFESFGALIRFVGPISLNAITQLEQILIAPLLLILQNDTTEFVPYVFQLLSQMLELHSESSLPETYKQLLRPILTPALWDSRGNIPALVRLLQAFIKQGGSHVVESGSLEPILGIFQKLISSKANDHFAFDLLESIYTNIPIQALANYNQQIDVLLLTRLNNSKTEKYVLRFIVFIFYISALDEKAGPDFIVKTMEAIQPGIFSQIHNGIILPNTQKILVPADTKTCSIGLTNFLTKSQMMTTDLFNSLWIPTLLCQLKFLELPATAIKETDNLTDIDIEDAGFQASFARLHTATKPTSDPWPHIPDPKQYLTNQLNNCNNVNGGKFSSAISAGVPADGQSVLRSYGIRI